MCEQKIRGILKSLPCNFLPKLNVLHLRSTIFNLNGSRWKVIIVSRAMSCRLDIVSVDVTGRLLLIYKYDVTDSCQMRLPLNRRITTTSQNVDLPNQISAVCLGSKSLE